MASKRTVRKKEISRECYDLDHSFLRWLKERLPVYLKEAGRIVDLTYHKFEYEGKTYTQEEMIKEMIRLVDIGLTADTWSREWKESTAKLLDLWKIVFPAMWW